MEKYTFICEFRGVTYISQYIAPCLKEALYLWGKELDNQIFTKKKKEEILYEIGDPDLFPVPLKNVENVWCSTYLSGKSFLLLNIIKTV